MTAIAESAECTTHQAADDTRGGLQPDRVFLHVEAVVFEPPDETRLGPDGSDITRCPGELPPEAWCDTSVPWAGIDGNILLTASGATREMHQQLVTYPGDTVGDIGPSLPGARALDFRQFDLAVGDPRGLVPYLRSAFEKCTRAKPTTIDGLAAMAGSAASKQGATVPAQFVLLTTGTRAAWVLLEGSGWTSEGRARALREVARFVRTTR